MIPNSTSHDYVHPQPSAGGSQRTTMTVQRRAQVMCQMRAEGMSLAEIGDAFGLTRERARQIIRDAGGPGKAEVGAVRRERRERDRLALKARMVAALEDLPGQTAEEVATRLRLTSDQVRDALGEDAPRLLIRITDWRGTDPDEALLADLREAARRVAGPLTLDEYARVRRDFGGHSPALFTVRFGYWRVACERAGVQCGPTIRTGYTRRWTPNQMVEHVADHLAAPEAPGTFAGYCEWASRTEGAPSGATVRNSVGTWADIKTRALIRLADRRRRDAA